MMQKSSWQRGFAILGVLVLLIADAGMGLLTPLGLELPEPSNHDAGDPADDLARSWSEGGTALMFVDNMHPQTARHFEQGSHPLMDYYGGAIPSPGEGGEKWRYDPYRWGKDIVRLADPMQGTEGGWSIEPGYWHYGEREIYLAGALSELVSPVVDLRSIDPMDKEARYYSESGVPRAPRVHQTEFHHSGEMGVHVEQESNARVALRLFHEYDFEAAFSGQIVDGARVEVSMLDPVRAEWTQWSGMTPTQNRLIVGEDALSGGMVVSTDSEGVVTVPSGPLSVGTHNVDQENPEIEREIPSHPIPEDEVGMEWSVSMEDGDPEASLAVRLPGAVDGENEARVDSSGPGDDPFQVLDAAEHDERQIPPHLYQGFVTSSSGLDPGQGPWEGFGGDSEGLVESVFDLSALAGHLVRLRFVVSTGLPPGVDLEEHPSPIKDGKGWLLHQAEVHGVAADGLDLLDLAVPGGDTVVAPGEVGTFVPVVAVQNRGRVPVDLGGSLAVSNAGSVNDIELAAQSMGTGPLGRSFVKASQAFTPGEGLHVSQVDVTATVPVSHDDPWAKGVVPVVYSAQETFRFLGGSAGGDLRVVSADLLPLVEDKEGEIIESFGRFLLFNQPALIRVEAMNMDTQEIHIDNEDLPFVPAVVDRRGEAVGSVDLVSGPESLPVSRSVSGALGSPDDLKTFVWEWSGSNIADAFRLVVEDKTKTEVLDAGRVLVESSIPDPLAREFRNDWNMETLEGCSRIRDFDGRRGVIRCDPGQGGTDVIAPSRQVTPMFVHRDPENRRVLLEISYNAQENVTATLQYAEGEMIGGQLPMNPPSGVEWVPLGGHNFTASNEGWGSQRVVLGNLPESPLGWIRFNLSSESPYDFDSVRFGLAADEDGLDMAPRLEATFESDITSPEPSVEATTPHGLVWLHGVDEWHGGANFTHPECPGLISILCFLWSDESITVEEGDVIIGGRVPTGRMLEPSVATLPGSFDLTDLVRPTLTFRHWFSMPGEGDAVVEAARVSGDAQTSFVASGDECESDQWETLKIFKGSLYPNLETVPARVSLDEFIGETICLRFRYSWNPTVELDFDLNHRGWIIEDILLKGHGADGLIDLHRIEHRNDYGSLQATDVVSSVPLVAGKTWRWEESGEPRFREWLEGENLAGMGNGYDGVPEPTAKVRYPGPVLTTEPIDIRGMRDPVLFVESSAMFVDTRKGTLYGGSFVPMMDLEYQVMQPDGMWPEFWARANPREPGRADGVPDPNRDIDPRDVGKWPDPRTGEDGLVDVHSRPEEKLVGGPYSRFDDCPRASPLNIGSLGNREFEDLDGNQFRVRNDWRQDVRHCPFMEHAFDLSPIVHRGESQTTRFRLAIWHVCAEDRCQSGNQATPGMDWIVHSMRVSELNPFADAAVTGFSLDVDDTARIRERHPGLLDENVPPDAVAVLANEVAIVKVTVENQGSIPLDMEVSLEITGPMPVATNSIVVDGDTLRLNRVPGAPAVLEDVPSQQSGTALFQVNFQQAPPGEYTIRSLVEATNALDTNPTNDLLERPLVVLPYRELALDPAQSRVTPLIGVADQPRTVEVHYANRGNVRERNVTLEADIVELRGPEIVDLPVPIVFDPREGRDVFPHSTAWSETTWRLNPVSIFDSVEELEEVFRPGVEYAVRVTIEPKDDSVVPWWDTNGVPVPEGFPTDLTRMPVDRCACMLLPFYVEDLLMQTDLTRDGTQTVLEDSFPVDSLINDWTVQTLLDGEPLESLEDRPDIPRWQLVSAAEVEDIFDGDVQGKVWSLPSYEGRESLTHVLESPVLPAHIVRPDSRAVLHARYASLLEEDQARLEVSRMQGGLWTDYVPIDQTRAQRVAIVLAPDYPRVISSDIAQPGGSYDLGIDGHPLPPFYYNPGGDDRIVPCIQEDGRCLTLEASEDTNRDPNSGAACVTSSGGRCQWSPFPAFPTDPQTEWDNPQFREWAEVFNNTLRILIEGAGGVQGVGAENIRIFTSLNPDFRMPVAEREEGVPVYRFVHDNVPYEFPIADLSQLAARLDTYNAILLMGDNTTTTFASESSSLGNFAYGPEDAANRSPSPLAVEHHERLFGILQVAPDAGVRVVGTIGPAAATLARSGGAGQAQMIAWQNQESATASDTKLRFPMNSPEGDLSANRFLHGNDRRIPDLGGSGSPNAGLRCTAVSMVNADNEHRSRIPNGFDDGAQQPLGACHRLVDGGNQPDFPDPDPANPRNYRYFSPYDAQAMAIRNLFGFHDARISLPWIEGLVVNQAGVPSINQFPVMVSRTSGTEGAFVVSSSRAQDTGIWVNQVLTLMVTTGSLPAGDGRWGDLPEALSFPVAGSFLQGADGNDSYEGSPFRFRIVVESDPAGERPGHNAIALDEIGLFGTPNEQGISIEVGHPLDGRVYAPESSPFRMDVVVTNRGITATPGHHDLALEVEQWWERRQGQCEMVLPTNPASLPGHVPTLSPGEHTTITVGLSGQQWLVDRPGLAPRSLDSRCNMEGRQNVSWVNLTAELRGSLVEDHLADHVAFRIGHVQQLDTQARVVPNLVMEDEVEKVDLVVGVENQGTGHERIAFHVSISDSRPRPCVASGPAAERSEDCSWWGKPESRTVLQRTFPDNVVLRDTSRVFTFPLALDDVDLKPGIYRVQISGDGMQSMDQYLHVVASEEEQGLKDGARTFDGYSLRNLPQDSGSWTDEGIFVMGSGDHHDGTFGPNPRTRQGDWDEMGNPLSHGWQVTEDCPGLLSCLEWRRSSEPSYPPGAEDNSYRVDGMLNQPQSPGQAGIGDFGPDSITWSPYDPNDPSIPNVETYMRHYLTLASLEEPVFSVVGRWQASEYTAFTVQMELATRNCNSGPTGVGGCSWQWSNPGLNLTGRIVPFHFSQEASTEQPSDGFVSGCGTTGTCLNRNGPSNPLAPADGIWGKNGPGSDDWTRWEFRIDSENQPDLQSYCSNFKEVVWQNDMDACRLAPARGNEALAGAPVVARPVRFTINAASFGGDSGESFLQIADVGLSAHRLGLLPRVEQIPVSMRDDDTDRIPIRITNEGSVDDIVQVGWRPEGARLPEADITLCLSVRCERDPTPVGPQELTFSLQAGASRVVWVRIDTDITGHPPGSERGIRFIVEARSAWDPTAFVDVLVNGAFQTRAWSDLFVEHLVLGGDAGRDSFQTAEGVPVQTAVVLRNLGHIDIGSEEEPVQVRLVERQYASDGTLMGQRDVLTHLMEEPLPPYRQTQEERFITLGEWIPPEQGLFEVEVLVNQPRPSDGLMPVPDQPTGVKSLARPVEVGPVRFADIHIMDAWLVAFGDRQDGEQGCTGRRVDRAIAGHAYCVAARVENRGQDRALDPVLRYGIGVASPFSVRHLENPFPAQGAAGNEVVVTSSPWVAALRPDGTNEWSFYVEITTASFSPNTQNKWREMTVPVDRYALQVHDLPSSISMLPGQASMFEFNVTNQGNAPVTPLVHTEGGNEVLRAHVEQAPILLPGETERVSLAVHTSSQARAGDETPTLILTTAEDHSIRLRLPVQLEVAIAGAPDAAVLPMETSPGEAVAVFAVDNSDSTVPTTWTLEATGPPLEPTAAQQWSLRVEPGERRFVDLPLRIANHTAPGPYEAELVFQVQRGDDKSERPVQVPLHVRTTHLLEATLHEDRMIAALGHPAALKLRTHNAGNMPLEVRVTHESDEGELRLRHASAPGVLPPGAVLNKTADVLAMDTDQVLGRSIVEWRPAGSDEPWQETQLLWQADYVPNAVRILRSDLDSMRLRSDETRQFSVTVKNPLEEPVEAEVLLVIDAQVHSQTTTTLGPLEDRVVRLPISTQGMNENHRAILVARPLGSQVNLEDPAFQTVGDSHSLTLTMDDRMIPLPGVGVLLALLVLLAGLLSMRRRREAT